MAQIIVPTWVANFTSFLKVTLAISLRHAMIIVIRYTLALAAAATVLAGCSRPSQTSKAVDGSTNSSIQTSAPRLSQSQALEFAKRAAEREGTRLSYYKEPEAHYKSKDRTWIISFTHVNPRPVPGYFEVSVDDRTGISRVVRGD